MGGHTNWRKAVGAVAAAAMLALAGTAAVHNAQAVGAVMSIDPPSQNVAAGAASITVNVKISGAANVGSAEFGIQYDKDKLEFVSVVEGAFLKSTGLGTQCVRSEDTAHYGTDVAVVQYGCSITETYGSYTGPGGDGVVATITFKPKADGVANFTFRKRELADPSQNTLNIESADGVVQVGATSGALQPTPTANAANLTPVALPPREIDPFVRGSSQPGSSPTQSSGASRSSTPQSQSTAPSGAIASDPSVYGPPAPAGGVLSADTAPAADSGPLSGGGDLATGANGAPGQAGSGFPHAGYGPQPSDPGPWWNRSELILFALGAALLGFGAHGRRRAL